MVGLQKSTRLTLCFLADLTSSLTRFEVAIFLFFRAYGPLIYLAQPNGLVLVEMNAKDRRSVRS